MSEIGSPSTITVERGKKSHFDKHEQDKLFFRCAAPLALRPPLPDSGVIARPHQRRFTAEYKRSILDQADTAQDSGAIGALLRRKGLYASQDFPKNMKAKFRNFS
jgi:hypothetical protein